MLGRLRKRKDVGMVMECSDGFPLNLAQDILGGDALKIYIPGVAVALETLTEREADILRKRYRDKMTLRAIGDIQGVGQERIRQIEAKALRKMRHPARSNMMLAVPLSDVREIEARYQKLRREYEQLAKELALFAGKSVEVMTEHKALMQTPLDELGLSVRPHNCLRRAGKQTLQDIATMSEGDLMQVKNLGKRSVLEVLECLKNWVEE